METRLGRKKCGDLFLTVYLVFTAKFSEVSTCRRAGIYASDDEPAGVASPVHVRPANQLDAQLLRCGRTRLLARAQPEHPSEHNAQQHELRRL